MTSTRSPGRARQPGAGGAEARGICPVAGLGRPVEGLRHLANGPGRAGLRGQVTCHRAIRCRLPWLCLFLGAATIWSETPGR